GQAEIYQAALAGAPDLPVDVSEWALEMSGRRPYRGDIHEKVRAHNSQQSAEHKQRLEIDPVYRARHQKVSSMPGLIPSARKLPPWPLGAKRRVEGHFRQAVLRSSGFRALMRTNAAVAG